MTAQPDETRPTRLRSVAAGLLGLMSPAQRRQLCALLGLMLIGALAELVSIGSIVPFLSILAGDTAADAPAWIRAAPHAISGWTGASILTSAAMLFIASAIAAAAIRLALGWASQRFTLGFGHQLSVRIQERILHQPYLFHVSQNSSRILASLEKVQLLSSSVLLQSVQAVSALIIGAFIVAAVASIDLAAAAIAAALLGASYLAISRVATPRLAHDAGVLATAYDRRLQLIQESLGGIRDVIVDHSQRLHLEEFRAIDEEFAQARLRSGFLVTAPRFVIEAAGMVIIAGLAIFLSSSGRGLAAALPILGALSLGALRLLPLVQQLYQAWVSLAANRSIASDVMALASLPLAEDVDASPPLPFEHSIELSALSFTYPTRQQAALEGIDLTIPYGSRVAIVGKTGSGKSTLVDILMGLLAPTHGNMSVDGAPLDDKSRRAWQRSVAHVPQSLFLADTSIARNIALSRPRETLDQPRIAEAARIAQLGDVIAGLPDGLDTPVGERGISLSGGQRQRLGLARAIYKGAPVLILDEATSALDHATEEALLRALDELQDRRRTIIIVSHRESALRNCNMVVRLDGGRIVK